MTDLSLKPDLILRILLNYTLISAIMEVKAFFMHAKSKFTY